ncbi:MAG TPA: efflux RND transporter periplasmic adaptor subunit [Candidatus Krumholzibacteria bacterium]|nr:efflux RND transporter periplasmic adaptor subunit [Candidatus Krumholzibacteria bacterium]HPD73113.1 efflux RND transporter periplasmic adaptor subunit [Candidatus Krumholzibacteria bacterium]HRY41913.1 efflux RND transporter periplasmic adaptor subunit [Candidatus Krumholzibacteria bacterium]
MRRKSLWIGVAAVVVVAGGVAGALALRGGGNKALEVQTAKVDRQKIIEKVNGTGTIQPKIQVKIGADVSAKITKLAVVEGQWVEKGTLLIELDRERYLAAVESAEASVRSAEANATLVLQNLEKTEKDFKRAQELLALDMESQAVFDATFAAHKVEVARYDATRDQVEQARAALKQARDDLSKTTIYAPMAGTITDLNKEQGEIAIGSQFQPDVILVISDLSEMEAQIDVDENDVVAVAVGQEAEIEVDALLDQTLTGVVAEIANSANVGGAGTTDQKTEFEVKIAITDPPATLRPGMTASADIFTKTNESALSVPIQSVAVRTVDQLVMAGEDRQAAEQRYTADRDGFVEIVFRVESGKAVARQVTTGIQSDELIEILDGLAEGDEVVTGSYRAISRDLVNGAVVTVNNEAAPAGEGAERGPAD